MKRKMPRETLCPGSSPGVLPPRAFTLSNIVFLLSDEQLVFFVVLYCDHNMRFGFIKVFLYDHPTCMKFSYM